MKKSAATSLRPSAQVSSAQMRIVLENARAELAETEHLLNNARARYDASLSDDDPKATHAADDAVKAGTILLDRARRGVENAERQLAEALKAEAEALQVQQYEAAQIATANAKVLQSKYAAWCEQGLAIIAETADAFAKINAANRDLPADKAQIEYPPFFVRSSPAVPEEIVSRKEVLRWHFTETGKMLANSSRVVETENGRGYLEVQAAENGGKNGKPAVRQEVELRKVWEVSYRPAQSRSPAQPIWSDVVLPGALERHAPFWPGGELEPEEVAEAVRQSLAQKRVLVMNEKDSRPVLKRIEPL